VYLGDVDAEFRLLVGPLGRCFRRRLRHLQLVLQRRHLRARRPYSLHFVKGWASLALALSPALGSNATRLAAEPV